MLMGGELVGMAQSTEQPTISRRIVRSPESGSPGTAGYGVAYDPGARNGERFRIEQLWPEGRAEPIYVREEDALELARAIMKHYEWKVEE
jgi:hypothetical protein